MHITQCFKLFYLALLTLLIQACALTGDAIHGRVLEAGTEQPVPDAIVVARWIGYTSSWADSHTVCYHVLTATTDSNGRYSMPAWRRKYTEEWHSNLTPQRVPVYAYKAGYEQLRELPIEGVIYLKPFMEHVGLDWRVVSTDEVNSRIADLAELAGRLDCFSAPQQQRATLIPAYKAMFSEARSIARHAEHHRIARGICRDMYWTQRSSGDGSLSVETEQREREIFLQGIEPECNAPIDDSREREILSAIAKNNGEAVRSAARDGFDFNRRLDGRSSPILTAAMKGSTEMVAALIAGGAKVDAIGLDRRTALDHLLFGYRGDPASRLSVVRELLQAGADTNRSDVWGYPPLVRIAAEKPADTQLFALLLEYGAHIDQAVSCQTCPDSGKTALHVATEPAIARLALTRGADVDARTKRSGSTPLMFAETPEMVQVLLNHGADPNATTVNDWTPLMFVLQRYERFRSAKKAQSYREIAELLVAAGARLDTGNQHGKDVLDYTKDEELKERLRSLAAKR